MIPYMMSCVAPKLQIEGVSEYSTHTYGYMQSLLFYQIITSVYVLVSASVLHII